MSSRRDQIIAAIAARLGTIRASSGYQTDIGSSVYLWRTTPPDKNELPCLLVYDRILDRDYDEAANTRVENRLQVAVVVCTALLSGGLTQARAAEADVVRCLGLWADAAFEALRIPRTELMNEQHDLDYWAVLVSLAVEYDTAYDEI